MLSVLVRRAGLSDRDGPGESNFRAPIVVPAPFFGVGDVGVSSRPPFEEGVAEEGGVRSSGRRAGKVEVDTPLAES